MSNINDIGSKISASLSEIETIPGKIELFGAQESLAIFIERVFTKGGVRDVTGQHLKPYTDAYKKYREKLGLQTKDKDLQVTGKLFRSVNVGSSQGKPAMGITEGESAKIAGYQEEQNGNFIFVLNTSERDQVKEKAREFARGLFKEIVSQWK